MGTPVRCAVAIVGAVAMSVLAGCVQNPTPTPYPTPFAATPSPGSPAGAMAGFLAAAKAQDNTQVPLWLATSTETTNLAELVRVYSDFGLTGGIFWEVGGLKITSVSKVDATHAHVVLNGDIVWCLGKAANDKSATCSIIAPAAGKANTYAAVQVDGQWKVDVDINASSGLDHNPQASPTASLSTAPA